MSVHVDDIGTIFRLGIREDGTEADVSAATTKQILFLKPDGSTLTKTATFTSDGTDGKIEYATIANDLDTEGEWQVQAFVILPTGQWSSTRRRFRVKSNIV